MSTVLTRLDHHCHLLGRTLLDLGQRTWPGLDDRFLRSEISNAGGWLQLAGSVVRVEVDTTQYSSQFGWCSQADEYHLREERLLARLSLELLRFTLIWSGCEALMRAIVDRGHQRPGLVRRTCDFLDSRRVAPVARYEDELRRLALSLAESAVFSRTVVQRGWTTISSRNAIGLRAAYNLRNAGAHGELRLPFTETETVADHSDAQVVYHCSRLALFSGQMLVAHVFQSTEAELEHPRGQYYGRASNIMSRLHIEESDGQEGLLEKPIPRKNK